MIEEKEKICRALTAMADTEGKYLTFSLAGEEYGIGILKIREIIGMQPVTSVPRLPEYVKGVINLRGTVIPVVDLRMRFGMPEREHDARTCIIIVKIRQSSIGFVVDTVAEVQDIPDADIEGHRPGAMCLLSAVSTHCRQTPPGPRTPGPLTMRGRSPSMASCRPASEHSRRYTHRPHGIAS